MTTVKIISEANMLHSTMQIVHTDNLFGLLSNDLLITALLCFLFTLCIANVMYGKRYFNNGGYMKSVFYFRFDSYN